MTGRDLLSFFRPVLLGGSFRLRGFATESIVDTIADDSRASGASAGREPTKRRVSPFGTQVLASGDSFPTLADTECRW
jgi:hypothetical protein